MMSFSDVTDFLELLDPGWNGMEAIMEQNYLFLSHCAHRHGVPRDRLVE